MSEEPAVPPGMTPLAYPAWATRTDPDIPHQLTAVAVRLYELFGSGTPATSALPEFPFSTATGEGSGIDAYDTLKRNFQRIESEFDTAAMAFKNAVQDSAFRTQAGRDAINDAIATFNTTAGTLDEGDWDGLLQAESTMLATVKGQVSSASSQGVPLPPGVDTPPLNAAQGIPLPGVDTPPPGIPPAATSAPNSATGLEGLLSTLGGGSPFGAGGLPIGGTPLGGLGGLTPPGGQGSPMGGGAKPLASNAVQPVSALTDDEADAGDDDEKAPIAPLNPGPHNPPPATAPPAEAAGVPEQGQPALPAQPAAARATVTLPDGTVIDAPNAQAATAAQNALDNASPGGDAAQKAYGPTGLDLPGEGDKNLGVKVDPSDMQPGDVLKWQDKTMVAVGPHLVADPSEPGVTHTLDAVFKHQNGFEGVFRPIGTTAGLPDLPQAPAAPPGPTPAPPNAVPLPGSRPAAGTPYAGTQGVPATAAPPSPFEDALPPPAV